MSEDLANWLAMIGLAQYLDVFVENDVDLNNVVELSEDDLTELGLTLGHRRTLQKALKDLSAGGNEASSPNPESAPSLAPWERHPDERKTATVLFADIMGSTALTEHLDAEDTHDLLDGARRRICAAVVNNSGTVCRVMGDGVMAVFGAPVASEHHALEACEAAMEMQNEMAEYAGEIKARHGKRLSLRVGLHSGDIVVLAGGDAENAEYDADGPAVPIAARMEQSAAPGAVYITAATQSLVENRIETEDLAPISVKGISDPILAYVLRRVRWIDEAPDSARTLFVGRRAELSQFKGMLEACIQESQGQVIYVRGEPGIGKTRLVEEFATLATGEGASCHRALVLPFGVGKGQDAMRALVRSLLGISPGGDKAARQRSVDVALDNGWLVPDQTVFLNDLLDLPQTTEQRALYDAMDNATRNEGKRVVIAALVRCSSRSRPLLVIIEDVHWADSVILTHLSSLAGTIGECRALLVMTSRIEGDQLDRSWRGTTGGIPLTTIDLGPLRKQDSKALIHEFMLANEAVAESCLERAAGNPLFLEQLLRNAQEGAAEGLPESIQTLVHSRLDRLKPVDKRALQAASVLGQRFHSDTLNHLLAQESYDCSELIDHNLVRIERDGYLFSHALIQEGVYSSLLKRQRRALHLRAADWFAEDLALHAQHLDYADDDRAPRAYLEAAHEQARQYRYETALTLIERGLELIAENRDRHPLICLKAELLLDSGEVGSSMTVYRQAEEEAVDDIQLFEAWMGQAACKRVTTDFEGSLKLLDRCEPVALRCRLISRLSRLHHLRGNLYFPLGNVEGCREAHQRALEYAREAGSAEDEAKALGGLGDAEYARGRMRSAHDAMRLCVERCREHGFGRVEVANLSQMNNGALFLGNCGHALQDSLRAVEAAVRVSHHRAEMNARAGVCNAAFELGDVERLETNCNRGMELAQRLKARLWLGNWLKDFGLLAFLRGDRERGSEELEQAAENVSALPFIGGWVYGALAMVTPNPDTRARALREGEKLLQRGTMGANHLYFYRFAMDASVEDQNWREVERYANALEDFTRSEPLPMCDFFIARARALVAFARGGQDDAAVEDMKRLYEQANDMGIMVARPALEACIASS